MLKDLKDYSFSKLSLKIMDHLYSSFIVLVLTAGYSMNDIKGFFNFLKDF